MAVNRSPDRFRGVCKGFGMTALRSILFLPLLSLLLGAQSLVPLDGPRPLAGSHYLDGEAVREMLAETARTRPDAYARLLERDSDLRTLNRTLQDTRRFWAVEIRPGEDIQPDDFYEVDATLRRSGDGVRIWVEDASWSAGYVTQSEVETIYANLTQRTPAGSVDPGAGIVDINTDRFGLTPDKAGDGITHFLILDIRDGFDPQTSSEGFIAGYFFSLDQSDAATSNRLDLLYIDSYPGIQGTGGTRSTASVLATTAHEFQHLIHFNYDTNEALWVNEGLSELAARLCGYGLGSPGRYFENPNRTLTSWSNLLADYSRVGLWTFYLWEQFGDDFIRGLTQGRGIDIAGFEAALDAVGRTDLDLADVFRDWTIANLVNDTGVDPAWGYRDAGLTGLRATVTREVSTFPELVSFTSASTSDEPIRPFAVEYVRFRGGDTLSLDFTSGLPAGVLMQRSATGTTLMPVTGNPFVLPDFDADDEVIWILHNTTALANSVEFCAWAPFSIPVVDLGYDDGSLSLIIGGNGVAANRFQMSVGGQTLRRVRLYNTDTNGITRIQVLASNGGAPGNPLAAPIDTALTIFGWVDIDLPDPVPIAAGQAFFVAVEAASHGYDGDSNPDGRSWYIVPGGSWRPLRDYQTTGENPVTLNGSWMIRAVLEGGLTASGPRGCDAVAAERLALQAPFPNPTTGVLNLRFDVTSAGTMNFEIFDVLGRRVATFSQGVGAASKNLAVNFTELDSELGVPLAAGVYFIRGTFRDVAGTITLTEVRRLVYVR